MICIINLLGLRVRMSGYRESEREPSHLVDFHITGNNTTNNYDMYTFTKLDYLFDYTGVTR